MKVVLFGASGMVGQGVLDFSSLERELTRFDACFYCLGAVVGPIYLLLKVLAPRYMTTTEAMGRAMINVAKNGWPKPVLESPDINAAAMKGPAKAGHCVR